MNRQQRVKAFAALGNALAEINEQEFADLAGRIGNENPWFTPANVRRSLSGIASLLDEDKLRAWLDAYAPPRGPKRIAIVMAGNIPFVGFHDLLSVLIQGHHAMVKWSSKDRVLPSYITGLLTAIEPAFTPMIEVREQLKEFDAVIATGSDNSARYFEYYFSRYPHIIRKNRTSVGIITGDESPAAMSALGDDVFSYFGLGCRNISKVYLPADYDPARIFPSLEEYNDVINHHKYCNNYDYQKSLLLINSRKFLDNGFLLLRQSEQMVSPVSVMFYESYASDAELDEKLHAVRDKIQVVAGSGARAQIPFGRTQLPGLRDYADNIDTMQFVASV